ncbi:hypothetical protein [Ulvibacter litoralis]|uniref:Uncharacterized protein n=1 Tax=Ulvibacter litoralis TaxID=227084 RepID=A0A1G7JHN2_9FLAO|nr:hypothetical protein [Ulvibacter litoralis]GHC65117.1 hypothetical protein GCM10008083_32970 [Ulvibacter litoralis]SDF24447.1 hypothetical protein SAMN05421855_1149 [Ulvibacter litoralis]
MKRYLAIIDNSAIPPNVSHIKDISEEEFLAYEQSKQVVDETHHLMDLFLIHKLNFHEIFDFQTEDINEILSDCEDPMNIGNDKYTFLKVEINRLLFNYLSSFRMFTDHCGRKIKHRFGIKSQDYIDFKLMTNKMFDNIFAYRFICELRDYCQHSGIAVTDFALSKQPKFVEIAFQFERDYLLEDKKKWKSAVKSDLEKMDEKFNINPILNDHFQAVEKLSEEINLLYQEKFMNALKYLDNFSRPYRNQDTLVILSESNKTELGMQLTVHKFPFDLIDKFGNGFS